MRTVALRDLVDVAGGGTPRTSVPAFYGGGIPWVTPKDMKRPLIGESEVTLTDDGVRNSPAKWVPKGSVLVVVRSGVLKHTLPVALTTRPVTLNQDMKALTPHHELDPSYLAGMLKALQPKVLSWVRATTADNFPIASLLDLEIDLPPLSEQRRIAAILDRADDLHTRHRRLLTYLDSLSHSIFRKTVRSSEGTATLGELGLDFVAGKNVLASALDAHATNRVIKVSAVSGGSFDARESKPMPATYLPTDRHRIRRGDILFGRASGSLELLGATAVVDVDEADLFLPDKVWRMEVREGGSLLPEFALALLRSDAVRSFIRHNASGAAGVRNIGKARLLECSVPGVSIDSQREYVLAVRKLGSVTRAARQARTANRELLQSLESRAFRGDL